MHGATPPADFNQIWQVPWLWRKRFRSCEVLTFPCGRRETMPSLILCYMRNRAAGDRVGEVGQMVKCVALFNGSIGQYI